MSGYMKADRVAKAFQSVKIRESDVHIFVFQRNNEPLVIPDPANREATDLCFAKYLSKYYNEQKVYWIPLDVYTNGQYWEDLDEPEEGEEDQPVWKRLIEIAAKKKAEQQAVK